MKINLVWLRRDLRLDDNTALNHAGSSALPVLPVFIFDTNITEELPEDDPRLSFIYVTLLEINKELQKCGSSVLVRKGDPVKIWEELITIFDINSVHVNKDYEPYAINRDNEIEKLLAAKEIPLLKYKDQVIFEEGEITKSDNTPYTIFTPYKNRWIQQFSIENPVYHHRKHDYEINYYNEVFEFPAPEKLGLRLAPLKVRPFDLSVIPEYEKFRDLPYEDRTSYLSPHLRFGTVSIRKIIRTATERSQIFLNELIWREFFMQILFSFPEVVTKNFKPKYDNIEWLNNEKDFERWSNGETGYPLVDAGMRQLNETGYMHNRVRMIAAGFLCKHLLTDWRWGEAYFAKKLLDYELSSNNGNWQWAAGTGCDAAPYFRIFNPHSQQIKFDPQKKYIRKWIKDFDKPSYPKPMIDQDYARKRAISVYKSGLKS